MKKLKFFFILCRIDTYGEKTAYIFVDFRIKRAGSSNYGGLLFFALCKKQTKINNTT